MGKTFYQTPAVKREIRIRLTGQILGGSLVDKANIVSKGQDVENLDFSSGNTEGFNHMWEN